MKLALILVAISLVGDAVQEPLGLLNMKAAMATDVFDRPAMSSSHRSPS